VGVGIRPIGNFEEHVTKPRYDLQVERQLGGSALNTRLPDPDPRLIPGKSYGHNGDENRHKTKIYPSVEHRPAPKPIWCVMDSPDHTRPRPAQVPRRSFETGSRNRFHTWLRVPEALGADLQAGWVSVTLRLGQELEVRAPPWPASEVAALLPEVVHRLLEFFGHLATTGLTHGCAYPWQSSSTSP